MTPPDASVFEETQWFYRRWWWLMLGATALLTGLLVVALHQPHQPEMPLLAGLLLLPLPLVVVGLWLLRLRVRVDAAGIHYRYVPFLNRWRHWPWSEFRQVYPRTYSPLRDYGGWGLRGFPSNLAYNVWGKQGVQLVFQSGDKLLLGTQCPQELRAVLAALQAADASRPIEL